MYQGSIGNYLVVSESPLTHPRWEPLMALGQYNVMYFKLSLEKRYGKIQLNFQFYRLVSTQSNSGIILVSAVQVTQNSSPTHIVNVPTSTFHFSDPIGHITAPTKTIPKFCP